MPDNNMSTVSIRIDTNVKKEAERLFSDLGLNLSSAVNVFLRQAIAQQALPFSVSRLTPDDQYCMGLYHAYLADTDPHKNDAESIESIMQELGIAPNG